MGNQKVYWFKRRRFGWGWTPVKWQGWAVVLGYIAGIVAIGTALGINAQDATGREHGLFIVFFLVLTTLLLRISMTKGPMPRWRWGKKPDDNPDEDI